MSQPLTSAGIVAQWGAIRRVYPIYTAVAKEFGLPPAPYPSLDELNSESEADVIRTVQNWLGEMDDCIEPHQFRRILESTNILNSEDKLRVLVRRHLEKEHRSEADRAKLHYLLTQYLVVCSPPSFRSREVKLEEVAQVLEPVLGELPTSVPESLEPLTCLVEQMPKCSSLGELQSSILEPGRELKAHALDSYFEVAALVVFTYFNYSARRTFGRLVSAELQAVEEGLQQLEAHDIKTLNCSSVGLSAEEPVQSVRDLFEKLKTTVAPAYSVDGAGKQIRALRLAVSAAVDHATTALTDSDQARISALEAQLHAVNQEVGELKRDLASVRSMAANFLEHSNRFARAAESPPAMTADNVDPAPLSAPASMRATGTQTEARPERNVAAEVDHCVEHLRRLLGDPSRKPSGLLKIGTETVLLAAGDIDAIRASGDAAILAQRAIGARILLIKFIENVRRGERGDVAPLSVFAQGLLTELERRPASPTEPARDALTTNSRQLRTVLQHAESAARKARLTAAS